MRSKKKRAVSLFLASVLALSAAGCSQTAQGAQTPENGRMEASTQASGNGEAKASDKGKSAKKEMTPWINSNVAGTVTESTKADLKDDLFKIPYLIVRSLTESARTPEIQARRRQCPEGYVKGCLQYRTEAARNLPSPGMGP